jgi:hypothetical protein
VAVGALLLPQKAAAAMQAVLRVRALCQTLAVSVSGFYDWLHPRPGTRAELADKGSWATTSALPRCCAAKACAVSAAVARGV